MIELCYLGDKTMRRYFLFTVNKPDGSSSQFARVTTRSLKNTVRRLGFDYSSESRDEYGNKVFIGLGTRTGFTLVLINF